MTQITLSEAIEALKANADQETVRDEIKIIEDEIKELKAEIKSKLGMVKILKRLSGMSAGPGRKKKPQAEESEIVPPLVQKVLKCLSGGPMPSDQIARTIGIAHGPVVVCLNKRDGDLWVKRTDGKYSLQPNGEA